MSGEERREQSERNIRSGMWTREVKEGRMRMGGSKKGTGEERE